jgi:hypothetical protein
MIIRRLKLPLARFQSKLESTPYSASKNVEKQGLAQSAGA